jgi:hypothetical protein
MNLLKRSAETILPGLVALSTEQINYVFLVN